MTRHKVITKVDWGQDAFEIDTKRFYFPATLTTLCHQCRKEITRDFRENYLMYPSTNVEMATYVQCLDCEVETEVKVILRVTLDICADKKGKTK